MQRTAAALIVLAGCACAPRYAFDLEKTSALELRKTTTGEYAAILGEPRARETIATPKGKFERVLYLQSEESADICFRTLQLEFEGGTLNGYVGASSCSDDATTIDPSLDAASLTQLRGRSSLEVSQTFGPPHGRILCPSTLPDAGHKCDDAAQLWIWVGPPSPPVAGRAQPTARQITISFDAQDHVIELEHVERRRAAR